MHTNALALGTALLVAGCASTAPAGPPASTGPRPATDARAGQPPAAAVKFSASKIPEVLVRAVEDSYRKPVPLNCATLGGEILALDAVLGADVDTLRLADRPGHVLESAVSGAITGLIPYHGVLRLLSGARQRARRVAEAVLAGDIRRGYLKGLGESAGCAPPAAPVHGDTMQSGPEHKPAG